MKRNIFGVFCLFLVLSFLFLLNKKDRQLEFALRFAENNRLELEKVLKHYKNNPEKLEAAKFLIRNMPGSYAVDSMIEKRYTPFYLMYDSLSLIYNENFPKER